MTIKKTIGKIHLFLGLASGLIVVFLGLTGCILAFQREIESFSKPYQFVAERPQEFLPPSQLKQIAIDALPGKTPHSATYGGKNKSAQLAFYNSDPDYYYIVYIDPYTGQVLKTLNMDHDFFRIVVMGHYYLWLPPAIGQPIVASATLIFLIMLISGLILWWPSKKAARKQRFTIKWNVRWRRKNYDLHNVLGFYMTWIAIFIAVTGLIMGFQWFAKMIYGAASGGKEMVEYYEPSSGRPPEQLPAGDASDKVWMKMRSTYPHAETLEIHYPENDSSSIGAGANPDADTYWKIDYLYFDQYTLQEIPVNHMYGRNKNLSAADKIMRMNYDVHVGAIGGLPTKILVFCASLIASSLPVTGFLIWRGRKKKRKHISIRRDGVMAQPLAV